MDAFESLVATLLQRQGYWTRSSFRVELTKEEKRAIGRHSSPRWEIDLVAYQAAKNELLVVECKSYLDSRGIRYRNGEFGNPKRFKLFTDRKLRDVAHVVAKLIMRLGSRAAPVDLPPCEPTTPGAPPTPSAVTFRTPRTRSSRTGMPRPVPGSSTASSR